MPHLILNSTPVELPATNTNLLDWLRDRGLVATGQAAAPVTVGPARCSSGTRRLARPSATAS